MNSGSTINRHVVAKVHRVVLFCAANLSHKPKKENPHLKKTKPNPLASAGLFPDFPPLCPLPGSVYQRGARLCRSVLRGYGPMGLLRSYKGPRLQRIWPTKPSPARSPQIQELDCRSFLEATCFAAASPGAPKTQSGKELAKHRATTRSSFSCP